MKTEIKYETEAGSNKISAVVKGDMIEIVAGIGIIINKIMDAVDQDKAVKLLIESSVDIALGKEKIDDSKN